jgi:hypothetical protein
MGAVNFQFQICNLHFEMMFLKGKGSPRCGRRAASRHRRAIGVMGRFETCPYPPMPFSFTSTGTPASPASATPSSRGESFGANEKHGGFGC